MNLLHYALAAFGLLGLWVNLVVAQESDDAVTPEIDEITIVYGKPERLPGSVHILSEVDLELWGAANIQNALRAVPGVNIQVEDGYGLRPNIGIRGVSTERSSRITLMEDGILIAPAPYSAPSAYYFPTLARMTAVEVVKGPAAITQGPYTIGGAINMQSRAIPDKPQGRVGLSVGDRSNSRVVGSYGGAVGSAFGFLVEGLTWEESGYQDLDGGGDTGGSIDDYGVKLTFSPVENHQISLRLNSTDQTSNQSYIGLTDTDIRNTPYRRYAVSQLDTFNSSHDLTHLRYSSQVQDLKFKASYYSHDYFRNWYKSEGLIVDGSRQSWFNVISAVNADSELAGLTAAQLRSVLQGSANTSDIATVDGTQLRSNARNYTSKGWQATVEWSPNGINSSATYGLRHNFLFGLRIHEDTEDRLQRNSTFHLIDGQLVLETLGTLGNAGNRIQRASATALFFQHSLTLGRFALQYGFRNESIDQSRTRYNTSGAERSSDTFRDSRSNTTDIFLPGIGITLGLDDDTHFLIGLHKGFTAPTNAAGVRPEEAFNYEVGFRNNSKMSQWEVVAFLSDYDNLLGECTNSSGSGCEAGDAFNGDAVTVLGIEGSWSRLWEVAGGMRVPVQLTMTFMSGEFDTDIADTDFFGDVSAGDSLPYIYEQQLAASIGIEGAGWGAATTLRHSSDACIRASCGQYERIEASTVVGLNAFYQIAKDIKLSASIDNLFGDESIVGRHPYGARTDAPLTANFTVDFNF